LVCDRLLVYKKGWCGMAKLDLNAEALGRLDNRRVSAAINHEVRRLVSDLQSRPGDDRARTLTIKMTLTPDLKDDLGNLETFKGEVNVSGSVPDSRSRPIQFAIGEKKGEAFFEESGGNPLQGTLDDVKKS